jgi:hypothetical protein
MINKQVSIKGYVNVKCNESSAKATRLRLVFQGSEAMLTYDVGPGVIRTQTNQLFGVRSVLWQKTDENELLNTTTTYKFLFTIQMPLVQYPPSIDHAFYRCCYKLSAYLDPSLGYGEVPVMTQVKIDYIPLMETKLLKSPLYLEDLKKGKNQTPPVSVKLHSIQYLSGDTIQANICITSDRISPNNSSSLANHEYNVTLNLYQISKFNLDKEPILTRLVCTQSHIIKTDNTINNSNSSIEQSQHPVSLKIDEELPPSFDYSRIMSLSYKLKVKVYIKKTRAPPSSVNNGQTRKKVKEIMTTLPWTSSALSMFETPIIIGTMGRGIRAMDGLKAYSRYLNEDDPVPIPKFVKNLVHEDELPKYEPARLPLYNDSYNHEQIPTIGTIITASPVTIIRSTL